MSKLAYPDLKDSDIVFTALLAHGLFAESTFIPPCFSSEQLLDYASSLSATFPAFSHTHPNPHNYVEYHAMRYNSFPRTIAFPHPLTYLELCQCIKMHWQGINEHIGCPSTKFNFCHVRKIKDSDAIFQMAQGDYVAKNEQEERKLELELGCAYVVKTDIANCFGSIYSHSIPWAVKGKEWSKNNRSETWKGSNADGHWCNDLDYFVRALKNGETNGLLVGPHTSNIVSEIILTRVDAILQRKGFSSVIRYIDDYTFYAKDMKEAHDFLRQLRTELRIFQMSLNPKKTQITEFDQFVENDWTNALQQFVFPLKDKLGFTSVNSFINFSVDLSKKHGTYAVLNYAIKMISRKELSSRSMRLYSRKLMQLSIVHPYILPLMEKHVIVPLVEANSLQKCKDILHIYVANLIRCSLLTGATDALAFAFYFATKYALLIDLEEIDQNWQTSIIAYDDCILMLLAYKYCEKVGLDVQLFRDAAERINNGHKIERDQFWLFLFETLSADELSDPFLKSLKNHGVTFMTI